MKKLFIPALLFLFIFTACEEQMVVIPENRGTESNRKILIEEFTGANCSACPQGSAAINDLISLYPGNVIPIAIHTFKAGSLGKPLENASYDLRTETGDEIVEHLGQLSAIPAAGINRKLFSGQPTRLISPYAAWSAFVKSELELAPEVSLNATANFDPTSRRLDVSATIIPQEEVTGDIRIVIYITESHIIDPQLNGTEVIPDYEHNHVLRTTLTSVAGESVVNGTMPAGVPVTKNIQSFVLPDEDGIWVAENCHIVAFITRFDTSNDTREVLQAFETDLLQ